MNEIGERQPQPSLHDELAALPKAARTIMHSGENGIPDVTNTAAAITHISKGHSDLLEKYWPMLRNREIDTNPQKQGMIDLFARSGATDAASLLKDVDPSVANRAKGELKPPSEWGILFRIKGLLNDPNDPMLIPRIDIWKKILDTPAVKEAFGPARIQEIDAQVYEALLKRTEKDSFYFEDLAYYPTPEVARKIIVAASLTAASATGFEVNAAMNALNTLKETSPELVASFAEDELIGKAPELDSQIRGKETRVKFAEDFAEREEAKGDEKDKALLELVYKSLPLDKLLKRNVVSEPTTEAITGALRKIKELQDAGVITERDSSSVLTQVKREVFIIRKGDSSAEPSIVALCGKIAQSQPDTIRYWLQPGVLSDMVSYPPDEQP